MKKNYFLAKLFAVITMFTLSNFFNGQTYCNPSYSSGCTSWRITQVTIPSASFNDSFASGTCITGRDRTSVSVNLSAGNSYAINITTVGWIACGMAIDFNKDGDFDDAGETLFLPSYIASDTQTYSGNFAIPSSVTAGNYRMRVWNRLANSANGTPADSPCGAYNYGTWTDYTANIGTLATSEVSKISAKIYPNPVSDFLNIEGKDTIESVEIYDMNGKLLKTVSAKSEAVSVKLSDLTPGIYFAKVNGHKDDQKIKFIKK